MEQSLAGLHRGSLAMVARSTADGWKLCNRSLVGLIVKGKRFGQFLSESLDSCLMTRVS